MPSVTMKITSGIHWISKGFFYFGLVAVIVMLVITCYDVFMRYVLAKPTSWAVELGAILLVYVPFISLPELSKRGHHIEMSILVNTMSKRSSLFTCLEYLIKITGIKNGGRNEL